MRCTPEAVQTALQKIDARHLRRQREPALDHCVNFCSNDYLNLSTHPQIGAAMAECALLTGVGAGASHLVSGHGIEHEALECELAIFTKRERTLVFSSGYMANLGVIGALAQRNDLILEDRLNHASLIDAGLLARTRNFERYPHGDHAVAGAKLSTHLLAHPASSALLITDAVFSMDGDIAPLAALATHALAHQAWLIVDDAHGFGVLGKNGGGCCELLGLNSREVPVLIGTLGKAFGTFGAFVAGDADLIELLMQRARSYIYTTALPPPVAAATRVALRLIQEEPQRRFHLHDLIDTFKIGAARRGLPLMESNTAIQPIILGSSQKAVQASARLRDAGYRVAAIRPPTVPQDSARLRVTLSAGHTHKQVEGLLNALVVTLGM